MLLLSTMQNNWSHQIHYRDKAHKKYLDFEISVGFFCQKREISVTRDLLIQTWGHRKSKIVKSTEGCSTTMATTLFLSIKFSAHVLMIWYVNCIHCNSVRMHTHLAWTSIDDRCNFGWPNIIFLSGPCITSHVLTFF